MTCRDTTTICRCAAESRSSLLVSFYDLVSFWPKSSQGYSAFRLSHSLQTVTNTAVHIIFYHIMHKGAKAHYSVSARSTCLSGR